MEHFLGSRFRFIRDREHYLGGGGMAEVYEASDTWHDRPVAIKILLPGQSQARFEHEMRMTERVREVPGLVRYVASGEDATLGPWLALEYAAGGTLREWLKSNGPLAPEQAVELLEQLAEPADGLHAERIVHRDIKPENILLDLLEEAGARVRRPLLADLGIALDGCADERLTPSNLSFGTPPYAAPEQRPGAEVGPAADVHALAVVLYEAVTGKKPPDRVDGVPFVRLLRSHAQLPAGFPHGLLEVIAVGMAPEPGDRFHSAVELAAAARTALAGEPAPEPDPTSPTWVMVQPGEWSPRADAARRWSARDVDEIVAAIGATCRRSAHIARAYVEAAAITLGLLTLAYTILQLGLFGLKVAGFTAHVLQDDGELVAAGVATIAALVAVVRSGWRPPMAAIRGRVATILDGCRSALRGMAQTIWSAVGRLRRQVGSRAPSAADITSALRRHGRRAPAVLAVVLGVALLIPVVRLVAPFALDAGRFVQGLPAAVQAFLGATLILAGASRSPRANAAIRVWLRRAARIGVRALLAAPGLLLLLPTANRADLDDGVHLRGPWLVVAVALAAAVLAVLVVRAARPRRVALALGGLTVVTTFAVGLVLAPVAVRETFRTPIAVVPLTPPFPQWPPKPKAHERPARTAPQTPSGDKPNATQVASAGGTPRYQARALQKPVAPPRAVAQAPIGDGVANAAGAPVQPLREGAPIDDKAGYDKPDVPSGKGQGGADPVDDTPSDAIPPEPEPAPDPQPLPQTETTTESNSVQKVCINGACTTTTCHNGSCSTTTEGAPAPSDGSSSGSAEAMVCDEYGCRSL